MKIQIWWKERTQIEKISILLTVVALLLLFSILGDAKAETGAEKNIANTCKICVEFINLNHVKQMSEKNSQCESYTDTDIEKIVSVINNVAESAFAHNANNLYIDCSLYNAQLQKNFKLDAKIQAK